jgi:ribonuclease P protein component
LFAAFVVCEPQPDGPHIGFTVPRAIGKAVVRNRIRRRVREAVRLHLDRLSPQWSIVINPRRKAFDAPMSDLRREVERLFLRCNGS